ncbi:uncharacterized protein LOC125655588 isoform X2 [Ostrea edulis]|uniref:uncharacterized protein LOC125655588 isoform X2 n=1 Tax=Ostrea edulis TaxID=37623 RepID=UPI0024AF81BA|nr:uncharacterized protein LOC125655588 isoform X2 [Ostrea edulis]
MSSGIRCSFLILTAIGNACFAYPIEGNLFSKRDDLEFANISTNFTVMDECERLYTCPKTSQYVFFVGDPEKDEVLYRKNYFTDVCRYVQELVDCGKELNIHDLPECTAERDFLTFYEETDTNFCKNPIFPLIQGLRQCYNKRYQQLEIYRKTLLNLTSSIENNRNTNDGLSENLFCKSYNQLLDQILEEFQKCPDVEFQWTNENIDIYRTNFYPALTGKPLPFQCIDPESDKPNS